MKKLIAILAIAAIAPQAYADGADFSHSGEYRLQHFMNTDADGADDAGAGTVDSTVGRFRWGTTFRKGDSFTGHLGLVHVGTWGSNASQTPAGIDANAGSANGNDVLVVNEAYGVWQATDEVSIKAGRGAATIGNGKHISKNDYEAIHKAFDGVLTTYDAEFGSIGLFFVQGAEYQQYGDAAAEDNEGTFLGLSFDFKNLPDVLKTANLHVIQTSNQANANTSGLPTGQISSMRIGLNVGGDVAGVDYDLTYVTESGENETTTTDSASSMMDVVVGYSMPDMMNFRVYAGMHSDTGQAASATDSERYSGFHYDTHNNAGLMDVFNWGGLTYNHVGFSLVPTDGLTVAFAYYMFSQTEKDDGTINAGSNGGAFGAADATEDDLGTEMDLVLTKSYGDDFGIQFRYGTFTPGDEYKGGAEDTFTQMYLAGTVKF